MGLQWLSTVTKSFRTSSVQGLETPSFCLRPCCGPFKLRQLLSVVPCVAYLIMAFEAPRGPLLLSPIFEVALKTGEGDLTTLFYRAVCWVVIFSQAWAFRTSCIEVVLYPDGDHSRGKNLPVVSVSFLVRFILSDYIWPP